MTVVDFPGITNLDISPDRVLNRALGKLDGVVVLGYDKDGQEYFKTSYADGGDMLWLLERAKLALMKTADELEAG